LVFGGLLAISIDNRDALYENLLLMSLSICTYGNPVLRKKAVEVEQVNDAVHSLVDQMLETMHREKGLGLAAEQVGRTERICVIDIPPESDMDADGVRENPEVDMPLVLINPRITAHAEEIQTGQEGCLSFPDIYAQVERWYEVDAEYLDLSGTLKTLHAKGLLSRAIQHELDHLDAVLLVDRMSPVKRVAISGKLKRLAKQTKRALI
jgi:peptide deformylase